MEMNLKNAGINSNIMSDVKVLAGIVLYNPDIKRLQENIEAIHQQVDTVILIENGSLDLSYRSLLKDYTDVVFVKNSKSMGIAYALNQILGYAYSHGYKWALTLDQDSVAIQGMIDVYKQEVNNKTGILGCWIYDRNYKDDIGAKWGIAHGTFEIDWVISSASFTNVDAWKKCGGFDTSMFIDWVDWDISEAMRDAGYKTYKTYKTKLIHELGNKTSLVKVRHHIMQIMNSTPFRYYHSYRNRIYMARKYKRISLKGEIKENLFKLYVVLKYEEFSWRQIKIFIKGMIDGFRMSITYNSITEDFLHIEGEHI